MSDRRVYPADISSLSEAYLRLQESLNDFKSYIGYIDIQPLLDEEVSMIYLEEEITELIEAIQRRHCK